MESLRTARRANRTVGRLFAVAEAKTLGVSGREYNIRATGMLANLLVAEYVATGTPLKLQGIRSKRLLGVIFPYLDRAFVRV